jgi:TatD DNase family protein
VEDMIDAHAHLLPDFIKKIDPLIVNARKSNLQGIVNSAIQPHQFLFAQELEKKNKGFIYTTMGFAPQMIKRINFKESFEAIKKFDFIKAIGEVGLDYHWIHESDWRKKQKEIFIQFIELANTLEKPLVVHSRKAETDCINILKKHSKVSVLMHCFAGNLSETERIVDLDWKLTVPTAVVNRKKHRKIARKTPLENILVETDSPYLSPIPGKRNEPANIRYAIEEIAKLKEISFEEVDKITTHNTRKFYNIR